MNRVISLIHRTPATPSASDPPARPGVPPAIAASLALVLALVAGCTDEEAVPIDPANPPIVEAEPPDITHPIQPTPRMEELARQQCVDDPSLDEGYVEAVDPETDQVLTQIAVDCAEVRSEG